LKTKLTTEGFSKKYLNKRIVLAKHFIDAHFGESIDMGNIADSA